MDSYLIAIPSKGRASRAKTAAFFPSAALFVPASEAKAYALNHANEIVPVPEKVKGITRTRNWIIDYAVAEMRDLVFVDDDVKAQGYKLLRSRSASHIHLRTEDWLAEFLRLFEVTRGMGFRIWGVSTVGALRSVYIYRPFLFQSYVTASCMGMTWEAMDGGLRFDEDFPVKEDYELCLRCIKEDGGVVAARFLMWANEHWSTPGGCTDYRTAEMEEEAIRRLIRMYPGYIRRARRIGTRFTIQLDF